ncbi:MAG: transporter substrate-binding domain-containing protein [Treponema sp.]
MKKCAERFFFLCLAVLLSSCAEKKLQIQHIEDVSLSQILVKRAIVIGVADYIPILSFRNANNEIVGYDIEIFEEVCRRLKIRPIFYPIDWAKKEELLNTGAIDCVISGFSLTEERKKSYTLIAPYLQNAQIMITLRKNEYHNFSDLQHKRIGVQADSLGKATVEKIPELISAEIVECSNFNTLCSSLDTEFTDGIVVDLLTSYDVLAAKDIYAVMEEPLSSEFYTFAFRKTDKTLSNKIEAILKEMDRDGTIPALSKKWFGANLSVLNIRF